MPQYIEFNGETIEFPDGMPDDQITSVLTGQKPSKSLQQMGMGEQALSGAIGGPEALASMATTATTGIISGATRGLYGAATGGLEHGAEEFHKGLEAGTYQPRSAAGKEFTQGLGEAYEAVKGGVGMAGGFAPAAQQALGIDFTQPLNQPKQGVPQFSEEARSATEGVFEGGIFTAPFRAAKKTITTKRVAREEQANQAMVREADALAQRLEAERQAEFQQATQQELPGFTELTREAEPRTPYNMPESLRQQLEAELNPPVETRQLGQGELFGEKPLGVVEVGRQREAQSLEYVPESPSVTAEGRMAQALGPEALRSGAKDQLTMGGIDYPITKPRLTGPAGTVEPLGGLGTKGFRQGGVINPDILKWGVESLVKMTGDSVKVLEKFKGTFQAGAIDNAMQRARSMPDRYAVVWMTPDEFHELAAPRKEGTTLRSQDDIRFDRYDRRQSIRQGLKSQHGLDDLPQLRMETIPDLATKQWKVTGHEGRHRMDVFKEQGIDLIPVEISKPMGYSVEWPKMLEQEYGAKRIPIRQPVKFEPEQSLDFTNLGGTGKKGFGQGGAITPFADFKRDLKARKIALPEAAMRAIWDKQNASQEPARVPAAPGSEAIEQASQVKGLRGIQTQYADRRPLEEVAAEIARMPADTLATMAGRNTVDKIIQGRFIAKDNPLLSWVSSNIHWTKQGAIQKANDKLHGKSRKAPDPGTYNYVWQQLDAKSRIAVNEVGQALQNADVAFGREGLQAKAREVIGRELSPKELQAYNDRIRINKEVLADFNKALAAEGKAPIGELPHYWSPAVFDGPFKVRFLNAAGETVKVHSAYLKPNIEKLKKQFPEYKVEEVPESIKGDFDWQQFEWILRQLHKEMRDPASRAITEGLRRQGFMRHGLKRKGVEGAAGTEGGKRGLHKYEEVSEKYIRQAYEYLGNRELDRIYQQVNELSETSHIPHTKAYSLEAIDAARGGSHKAFEELSRLASAVVSGTISVGSAGKLNLPQRFTRDLLRYGNKVKTTLLLGFGNVLHLGAQVLQAPTFMPPKLLAMAEQAGINQAKVFKVMAEAGAEYMKWNDSPEARKLQEMGAFEATFQYDWSTYAGDANPRFKQSMADHLQGVTILSWVESNAVRRPAALMFLKMLKEIGYDKVAKTPDEIYQVAKELTDHYMVSTRFYEKPHVFSRTGLVGMALSPLQSFATTWLGMLREYGILSAKGLVEGSVAKQLPLAAFVASNLLTAGMLGMVGVREWDAIAKLLNDSFGYNVPTGTEYILSKFKSDKMRFGLLSDAMGLNVGATFGSPTLTGSFAPGIQVLGAAAKFGSQLARQTGVFGESNKPTDVELREGLKGVTPRFSPIPVPGGNLSWGTIEKKFTPKDAPYQETSGKAGPITRDADDWMARQMGTYTLKEAREKTEHYTAVKKQKTMDKVVNRAVDIMTNNPDDMPKLPALWGELLEKQFTAQEIQAAVKREVLSRLMEADVAGVKGGQTARQQRLYMLYEQLK